MNAREWIDAYAERLGTTAPSPEDFSLILEPRRRGGPCVRAGRGAGRVLGRGAGAGVDLEQALEAAREIGDDG